MTPRQYHVQDRSQLKRLAAMLGSLEINGPLLVELSDYRAPKTRSQENMLHSIFTDAAQTLEVNGQRFSAEAWKELVVSELIGTEDVVLPDGEVRKRRRSTTKLNVAEYTELIDRTYQYLAEHFNYLPTEVV